MRSLCMTLALVAMPTVTYAQADWFSDDFESYGNVSSFHGTNGWGAGWMGSPRRFGNGGDAWRVLNGELRPYTDTHCGQQWGRGDCMLGHDTYPGAPGGPNGAEPEDNFIIRSTPASLAEPDFQLTYAYRNADDDSIGMVMRVQDPSNYYMFIWAWDERTLTVAERGQIHWGRPCCEGGMIAPICGHPGEPAICNDPTKAAYRDRILGRAKGHGGWLWRVTDGVPTLLASTPVSYLRNGTVYNVRTRGVGNHLWVWMDKDNNGFQPSDLIIDVIDNSPDAILDGGAHGLNQFDNSAFVVFGISVSEAPVAPTIDRNSTFVTADQKNDFLTFDTEANRNATWTLTVLESSGDCSAGSTSAFMSHTAGPGLRELDFTFPGMNPGDQYCWRIRAENALGFDEISSTTPVQFLPRLVATAPAIDPAGPGAANFGFTSNFAGSGVLQYAPASGTAGNVLRTGGAGTYAQVWDRPGLRLGTAQTAEAWIRPDAATPNGWSRVIGKGPYGRENFGLWRHSGGGVMFALGNTSVQCTAIGPANALPANQWHHVAGRYDGTRIEVYVDGQRVGNSACNVTPSVGNSPLLVGYDGQYLPFAGQIAHVALHAAALAPSLIAAHGEAPVSARPAAEASTVLSWNFNETSAMQVVFDDSGRGHHGFLGSNPSSDSRDPARAPNPSNVSGAGNGTTTYTGALSGLVRGQLYQARALVTASGDAREIVSEPVVFAASDLDATITVRPQPERAEYEFEAGGDRSWTIELLRREGATCTDLLQQRTIAFASRVAGLWAGLGPDTQYCWRVTTTGMAEVISEGTFGTGQLPAFTGGPTADPNGLAVDFSVVVSAAATGAVEYRSGDCRATHAALEFAPGKQMTVFGDPLSRDAHSITGWLSLPVGGQSGPLVTAEGGNIALRLANGRLSFAVTTSAGVRSMTTSVEFPAGRYVHFGATYDGTRVALYIDGVNRGSRTYVSSAPVSDGPGLKLVVGDRTGGFLGTLTSMALYGGAMTSQQMMVQYAEGAHARLTMPASRIAAWTFDEATGVQSIYDEERRWPALRGADHNAGSDDPARAPSMNWTNSMGSGTSLSASVSSWSSGPTYCYRVAASTAQGTIVTPLDSFTRNVDVTGPSVVATALTVEECAGNSATSLSLAAPVVTDDYDARPTLVARLGSTTGPVINFPYSFRLGTNTVYWVATDASGNVGFDDQVVRIRDTERPAIDGGADVTIEATSPSGTPFSPGPTSRSDTCLSPSLPSFTHDGPPTYPLGPTTVTFTARDSVDNTANATRRVRVVDTSPPVFDPPLATITVASASTGCFEYAPPRPSVRDNGYPAAQITVNGVRTAGPGAPGRCWNLGTHQVAWTAEDPAGNRINGNQTIIVAEPTLAIVFDGLEVRGASQPAGRFFNAPVTVRFRVLGGTPGYEVSVFPASGSVSNNGNAFRVTFDEPGTYEGIQVLARDGGGAGGNYGAAAFDGFGIDVDPPSVDGSAVMDQTAVVHGNFATYPYLFFGESIRLDDLIVRDGQTDLTGIGRALAFDGDDVVVIPDGAGLTSQSGLTVEGWIRTAGPADAFIIDKRQAAGVPAVRLGIRDGRASFELFVDGALRRVVGRPMSSRQWHHIAATYDGRVMRLYVDALPSGSREVTGDIDFGQPELRLGTGLEGALADVAIWRTALDEAALRGHQRGGSGRRITPTSETMALYRFDGTTQTVSDSSGHRHHGTLGAAPTADTSDPARVLLAHPADDRSSGLVRVVATLRRADGSDESELLSIDTPAAGAPLAKGTRVAGGLACSANVGAACNPGSFDLDAEMISRWDQSREGAYHLHIEATDAAGNTTIARVAFRTQSYRTAIGTTISGIDALIADPLNNSQSLDDARRSLDVSGAYLAASRPYFDGSYLRSDQAIVHLQNSRDDGVDTRDLQEHLSRAMHGAIRLYTRSLATQIVTSGDQRLYDDGQRYMLDGRFARFDARWGSMNAITRTGLDAVAQLYPPYQRMRNARRATRTHWTVLLQYHGQGQISAARMIQDFTHRRNVEQMVRETRDMLRDVLHPEVDVVLNHPLTNERRALSEMLDVIDKSSTDVAEEGDLTSVSNGLAVRDACLDLLTGLQLPDDVYTKCYLRLNDLAQRLDSVSEPLVPNYRWRAGLAEVLFNMLELTMFVSPTGLPWITSNAEFPEVFMVLPNSMAATHPNVVAVSEVDFPDGRLAAAYAQFAAASAALETGDVDVAWAMFLDNRCTLLDLYNRYYSDLRAPANVADPKEPALNSTAYGCATP